MLINCRVNSTELWLYAKENDRISSSCRMPVMAVLGQTSAKLIGVARRCTSEKVKFRSVSSQAHVYFFAFRCVNIECVLQ